MSHPLKPPPSFFFLSQEKRTTINAAASKELFKPPPPPQLNYGGPSPSYQSRRPPANVGSHATASSSTTATAQKKKKKKKKKTTPQTLATSQTLATKTTAPKAAYCGESRRSLATADAAPAGNGSNQRAARQKPHDPCDPNGVLSDSESEDDGDHTAASTATIAASATAAAAARRTTAAAATAAAAPATAALPRATDRSKIPIKGNSKADKVHNACVTLFNAVHETDHYSKLPSQTNDEETVYIADIAQFIEKGEYKEGDVERCVEACYYEIKEVFDRAEEAGVDKGVLQKLHAVVDTTFRQFDFGDGDDGDFVPRKKSKSCAGRRGSPTAANGIPGGDLAPGCKRPQGASPTVVDPTLAGVSGGAAMPSTIPASPPSSTPPSRHATATSAPPRRAKARRATSPGSSTSGYSFDTAKVGDLVSARYTDHTKSGFVDSEWEAEIIEKQMFQPNYARSDGKVKLQATDLSKTPDPIWEVVSDDFPDQVVLIAPARKLEFTREADAAAAAAAIAAIPVTAAVNTAAAPTTASLMDVDRTNGNKVAAAARVATDTVKQRAIQAKVDGDAAAEAAESQRRS